MVVPDEEFIGSAFKKIAKNKTQNLQEDSQLHFVFAGYHMRYHDMSPKFHYRGYQEPVRTTGHAAGKVLTGKITTYFTSCTIKKRDMRLLLK